MVLRVWWWSSNRRTVCWNFEKKCYRKFGGRVFLPNFWTGIQTLWTTYIPLPRRIKLTAFRYHFISRNDYRVLLGYLLCKLLVRKKHSLVNRCLPLVLSLGIDNFFFFFLIGAGLPWQSRWQSPDACNAGDTGLIPALGRSPGEGNGNSFQYSCLENFVDRGAWWALVHAIAKSWIWISDYYIDSF